MRIGSGNGEDWDRGEFRIGVEMVRIGIEQGRIGNGSSVNGDRRCENWKWRQ